MATVLHCRLSIANIRVIAKDINAAIVHRLIVACRRGTPSLYGIIAEYPGVASDVANRTGLEGTIMLGEYTIRIGGLASEAGDRYKHTIAQEFATLLYSSVSSGYAAPSYFSVIGDGRCAIITTCGRKVSLFFSHVKRPWTSGYKAA